MDTKPFCEIKVFDDFVPDEFVNGVLAMKDACQDVSGVVGQHHDGIRQGTQRVLMDDIPMLYSVQQKLALYTGIGVDHQEPMLLLKYGEGGYFKPHHDAFGDGGIYNEAYEKERKRGQRLYSVLIGIQQAEGGGETHFPTKQQKFNLRPKQMIYWNGFHEGKVLMDSLHEGMPVTKGEKLVVVCWIRDRPFI